MDLRLLIDAEDDRPLGWVQVQADDVMNPGRQLRVGGELEGRCPPGLHTVLTPHSGDGVAAHTELAGQQPGRPVGDAQPGRRRAKGDLEDFGPAEPPHSSCTITQADSILAAQRVLDLAPVAVVSRFVLAT